MTQHTPTRRGVAMLLVLVVLVVAVTAAANVARVSVTALATESVNKDSRWADDLLLQAERAAFAWLRRESSDTVLPPGASAPSLGIMRDLVSINDRTAEIRVTAIDLTGMVPIAEVSDGSDLRNALPGDVLQTIELLDDRSTPLGPDQLVHTSFNRPVFPEARRTDPVHWSEVARRVPSDPGPSLAIQTSADPSVTELVAFVVPAPPRRRGRIDDSRVLINVNTAPIPLLARALASRGVDALEPIITARENGEPASVAFAVDADTRIRFATSSPLWAFRSDVRVGGVQRSWWSVFEQRSGSWRLVRRISIHG